MATTSPGDPFAEETLKSPVEKDKPEFFNTFASDEEDDLGRNQSLLTSDDVREKRFVEREMCLNALPHMKPLTDEERRLHTLSFTKGDYPSLKDDQVKTFGLVFYQFTRRNESGALQCFFFLPNSEIEELQNGPVHDPAEITQLTWRQRTKRVRIILKNGGQPENNCFIFQRVEKGKGLRDINFEISNLNRCFYKLLRDQFPEEPLNLILKMDDLRLISKLRTSIPADCYKALVLNTRSRLLKDYTSHFIDPRLRNLVLQHVDGTAGSGFTKIQTLENIKKPDEVPATSQTSELENDSDQEAMGFVPDETQELPDEILQPPPRLLLDDVPQKRDVVTAQVPDADMEPPPLPVRVYHTHGEETRPSVVDNNNVPEIIKSQEEKDVEEAVSIESKSTAPLVIDVDALSLTSTDICTQATTQGRSLAAEKEKPKPHVDEVIPSAVVTCEYDAPRGEACRNKSVPATKENDERKKSTKDKKRKRKKDRRHRSRNKSSSHKREKSKSRSKHQRTTTEKPVNEKTKDETSPTDASTKISAAKKAKVVLHKLQDKELKRITSAPVLHDESSQESLPGTAPIRRGVRTRSGSGIDENSDGVRLQSRRTKTEDDEIARAHVHDFLKHWNVQSMAEASMRLSQGPIVSRTDVTNITSDMYTQLMNVMGRLDFNFKEKISDLETRLSKCEISQPIEIDLATGSHDRRHEPTPVSSVSTVKTFAVTTKEKYSNLAGGLPMETLSDITRVFNAKETVKAMNQYVYTCVGPKETLVKTTPRKILDCVLSPELFERLLGPTKSTVAVNTYTNDEKCKDFNPQTDLKMRIKLGIPCAEPLPQMLEWLMTLTKKSEDTVKHTFDNAACYAQKTMTTHILQHYVHELDRDRKKGSVFIALSVMILDDLKDINVIREPFPLSEEGQPIRSKCEAYAIKHAPEVLMKANATTTIMMNDTNITRFSSCSLRSQAFLRKNLPMWKAPRRLSSSVKNDFKHIALGNAPYSAVSATLALKCIDDVTSFVEGNGVTPEKNNFTFMLAIYNCSLSVPGVRRSVNHSRAIARKSAQKNLDDFDPETSSVVPSVATKRPRSPDAQVPEKKRQKLVTVPENRKISPESSKQRGNPLANYVIPKKKRGGNEYSGSFICDSDDDSSSNNENDTLAADSTYVPPSETVSLTSTDVTPLPSTTLDKKKNEESDNDARSDSSGTLSSQHSTYSGSSDESNHSGTDDDDNGN